MVLFFSRKMIPSPENEEVLVGISAARKGLHHRPASLPDSFRNFNRKWVLWYIAHRRCTGHRKLNQGQEMCVACIFRAKTYMCIARPVHSECNCDLGMKLYSTGAA